MSAEQPWTIGRLLEWTTGFLEQKGAEEPRLDTQVLLAHALGCKRIDLYTRHEEVVADDVRQTFKGLLQQRVKGCPVAYLVGRKEFFSLEFEVNPAVLIPRRETEHLVEDCLRLARDLPEPAVLDVGTGSGCLAVTVARQNKKARVTAVDLSPEALAVAGRNAAKHGVTERVCFLQGDLFAPVPSGERFDFVLSNPPYIPRADLLQLAPSVRDYEPRLALDGGEDGLAILERLIEEAPRYLKPGGYLIVEINTLREEQTRQRILARAGYELARTIPDWAGRPRVLRARWRPSPG